MYNLLMATPQPRTNTLDEFFLGYEASRTLFEAVRQAVISIGICELRVTKSQIAFRCRKAFAWVWIPAKYLRGKTAPLVLTISLSDHNYSSRWKEVVEPYPNRFMHHLELFSVAEIDDEVCAWLREAWLGANQGT